MKTKTKQILAWILIAISLVLIFTIVIMFMVNHSETGYELETTLASSFGIILTTIAYLKTLDNSKKGDKK